MKALMLAAVLCLVIPGIVLAGEGCPGCPGKEKNAEGTCPATCNEEAVMPQISVEVVNLPEQTAAVMAKIGPYEGTGKSLEELFAWVGKRGVEMTGPPFGAYYDDPGKVAPESTRYEVGVPVPGGTASDAEAGVEVKAWGAMQVVKTLYKGPYDKMGPTYGALSAWLFENGYRMAGPAIERYLNSLEAVAPEELLTEVCFVVDKAETATPAVEDEQSSP